MRPEEVDRAHRYRRVNVKETAMQTTCGPFIVAARLPPTLILTFSHWEKGPAARCSTSTDWSRLALPLPEGEGWGEGQGEIENAHELLAVE